LLEEFQEPVSRAASQNQRAKLTKTSDRPQGQTLAPFFQWHIADVTLKASNEAHKE